MEVALKKDPGRCGWCGTDPLYVDYHDEEWGVPITDDRKLFELLLLEGAQAGLAWITILRKRENYRRAFDRFDPEIIASYGPEKVQQLLGNAGIVRNRLKISSFIGNARAYLAIQDSGQTFSHYLWQMNGPPRQNDWKNLTQVPAKTPESDRMSRELKRQGFRFVGSTICYAFMQSAGMVNDHVRDCFRWEACRKLGRKSV